MTAFRRIELAWLAVCAAAAIAHPVDAALAAAVGLAALELMRIL
jgi:hypothetical protein